ANRALTLIENVALRQKLSEYHTGLRAYRSELLAALPLELNSDDFVFDNQMLAQCVHFNFRIGEVSCPTKYFEEASSINFRRSVTYGLGVLKTTMQFALQRAGLAKFAIFSEKGRRLEAKYYEPGAAKTTTSGL
ncbi:MAG: glycosyltransferase family 2 protein, partial [Terriglobales bacterium]